MKKLLILTVAIMSSLLMIKAQTADPELDYIKKAYSKEKKSLVDEYMNLDVQEGAKFWPVYGEYDASREKLAQQRVELIKEYVNNSGNLTAERADKIAQAVLANNISLDKLNLKYYKKMKKAVGPVKAAKYMQLESYLQTSWRSVIQDEIPFIGELEKSQKN